MTDITVKSGDTPWKYAVAYTSNGNNWPQFCAANPQLKKDATAGCLFYPGNVVHLPSNWAGTNGSLPAPIPGPVPQPVGPPVPTPDGSSAAPAPSPSLIAGLDPQKVMIGGALVAGAIVLLYAMKKKTRTAAA